MRIRHAAAALAAAALLTLTACEGSNNSPTKPDSTAQDTSEQPKTAASTEAADEATDEAEPETSEVPDVVGMNHGEAQSLLRSKGFMVNEEDASPEGRWILDNSNWKVCRQDPAPGATDALRVAIYSVKLDESC
jgi:hypothetical protein